jgi:hypothetical protein
MSITARMVFIAALAWAAACMYGVAVITFAHP